MTELYTRFARGLLFPLHERLKGHRTVAVHRELERTQWLSPPALQAYQNDRLRRFIADVYQHVPYYRQLLDGLGLGPGDIIQASDLPRLPLARQGDYPRQHRCAEGHRCTRPRPL